ncbi:MAG: GAF domain-containing protein [Actinomycetota bacterium]
MMRSRGIGILDSLTTVPRPRDEPRVHASGLNADRILLLGAGPAVGWGMATNDLALPGALARAITAITGRGSDVDVVSAPVMSALTAKDALSDIKLWRYDAVVLTLGLNEAVQLASIEAWLRDLVALLAELGEGLSRYAQVFVLGIHSLTQVGIFDRLVDGIATRHLRAFNRATSEIVADTERASFVPFDADREGETVRTRTAKDYQFIARLLAAAMAPALEFGWSMTANTAARHLRTSGNDEEARLEAVAGLDILDTEPEERFDKLVTLARQVFGTGSAAITIIDRDRQWTKAGAGPFAQDVGLESSICRTTISTASGLVLADASTDERFTDVRVSTNGPLVRFYAGFPIEAPTGERIGALCVFDAETRDPSDVDRALLRDLALLAQSEIWARAAG